MTQEKSKIVFLDTNVYLHYQLFDQIKWPEIIGAEKITIVVPPVVIRELNKHKDLNSRPRIKKRAGKVLRKLFELFDSDPKTSLDDNIEIWLEDREPLINFAAHQLNPDIQDDILIGNIIMYQNEMPDAEIVLVTSDMGLTLVAKARRQELDIIRLPDSLKIPEEPDPSQQRIKQLEEELRKMKLRLPQLLLTFNDGSNRAKFAISPPARPTSDELKKELEKIRNRYPKMEAQPNPPRNKDDYGTTMADIAAAIAIQGMNSPSSEDITKYNEKLDKFYEAYAKYLENSKWYNEFRQRTIKMTFWLVNNGTAPAEDIDVFMHFPDGFRLFDEENFPNSPIPPKAPSKPKSRLDAFGSIRSSLIAPSYIPSLTSHDIGGLALPPPNMSSLNIRRTNSYEVSFDVQRLKHNMQEQADTLYVVFDSFEDAKNFKIDYEILCADVPDKITGALQVIVETE